MRKLAAHRRCRGVFLPAVDALVRLGLADTVSASFQAVAELVNKLASGEVAEDLGATFELGKFVNQLSRFEDVVRRELGRGDRGVSRC